LPPIVEAHVVDSVRISDAEVPLKEVNYFEFLEDGRFIATDASRKVVVSDPRGSCTSYMVGAPRMQITPLFKLGMDSVLAPIEFPEPPNARLKRRPSYRNRIRF